MAATKEVLIISKESSYLVNVGKVKGKYNTKDGWVDVSVLKKKKIGDKIKTNTGVVFHIAKPGILDILRKRVKRAAQVMLPKDIVSIISNIGLVDGSFIVESGTGSGYCCIFLAKMFPKNKIVTYELEKRFYDVAKSNIKAAEISNVKIKNRDVTKGIQEKKVDLVILDLKDSWKVLEHAHKSLNVGGWVAVYSPTADHLIKISKTLTKLDFGDVRCVENIEREWQFTKTVRPKTMGMMHTGFLTFARKFQ